MEEEKTAIHTEYEQERIAYQKLLKEYNMLEAANDDLKEKVNKLRGGKHEAIPIPSSELIIILFLFSRQA